MKNILIFLIFLGIFAPLTAQNESLETKMFFPDRESAEKAFLSGDFRFYQPDPNNLKARSPRLAKGLPCTYIALEEVRENKEGSPAWVLLPSGTPTEFNSSGMPIVDGRCWNKITEAYPVEKYVPLSQIGKLYGPPGKDGRDGINGKDGRNGKDAEVSSNWLLWTGVGVAIVTAVVTLFFPRHHDVTTSVVDDSGKGPGGHTGPAFSIEFSFGK